MEYDWRTHRSMHPRVELSTCPGCGWKRRHDIDLFCVTCEYETTPSLKEGNDGVRIAWDAFLEERDAEAEALLIQYCFFGASGEVWKQWKMWRLLNADLRIDRPLP